MRASSVRLFFFCDVRRGLEGAQRLHEPVRVIALVAADRQAVESKIEEIRRLATIAVSNQSTVAQLENKVLNSLRSLDQVQSRECLECLSRLL